MLEKNDVFFSKRFDGVHRLLQVEGAHHDCYCCVVSGIDISEVLSETKSHSVSQMRALWTFRSSEGIVKRTQEKGFIEEAGLSEGEATFLDFSKN